MNAWGAFFKGPTQFLEFKVKDRFLGKPFSKTFRSFCLLILCLGMVYPGSYCAAFRFLSFQGHKACHSFKAVSLLASFFSKKRSIKELSRIISIFFTIFPYEPAQA